MYYVFTGLQWFFGALILFYLLRLVALVPALIKKKPSEDRSPWTKE